MAALRDFITALDKAGLLLRVHERVDWKYEIGKIARENKVPLLFENIKDYPNKRLFVNGLASYSSIALALGSHDQRIRSGNLAEIVKKSFAEPIAPSMVESSPVWENRITESIDLTMLPVPWWSELDAGRYIGTWHVNISRDPETGIRNVGVFRMQIVDPNRTTISVSRRSHLAMHIAKAEKRGEALPMAVAIGVDERLIISAAAAPAYGIDEYALAGGLVGRPIDIFRCKTQPIEAPADSEVVIEGYIKPGIRVQDGPFLDYAGIPSINAHAYLFEATGLFFRHDIIFRGTAVGRPGAEDHQLYSVLAGARLADFHGSRIRHMLQTFFLRHRAFKIFQLSGRLGYLLKSNRTTPVTGG